VSPFSLTNWRARAPVPDKAAEARPPVAVVDIGSNSVRLVVYEAALRAPTPLFNEKVSCGLGKTVASTGMLGEQAVARAVMALNRFRAIARTLGVGYLKAVATAAVREAKDGAEFIRAAEQALGWDIEILSGDTEAELAARGILMGFIEADGVAGDLGGGSLELISIAQGQLAQEASLPLGTLRLADTSANKPAKAYTAAQGDIAELDWVNGQKPRRFYAVGGTWRNLAKLHMTESDYPLRVMHHYKMSASEAVAFCKILRQPRKLEQLKGYADLSETRRAAMPYGAAVLQATLEALKPKDVVVSVFGIREGLLYGLIDPVERERDPLISFCEGYEMLRSRSPGYGEEFFNWCGPLFPDEKKSFRRLRLAACLLADIGWRAHPDYRGEQSVSVVAHAALTGIDHPARAFLAMSVFYRHSGNLSAAKQPPFVQKLQALAGPELDDRARLLALAVRAAHMLACGRLGILSESPLRIEDGVLKLQIPGHYAGLDGERLRRRFAKLAQAAGYELDVAIEA